MPSVGYHLSWMFLILIFFLPEALKFFKLTLKGIFSITALDSLSITAAILCVARNSAFCCDIILTKLRYSPHISWKIEGRAQIFSTQAGRSRVGLLPKSQILAGIMHRGRGTG